MTAAVDDPPLPESAFPLGTGDAEAARGVRGDLPPSDLSSGEDGISPGAGSGEKSARSSRVKMGGGGRSDPEPALAKFSFQRAETAAAWPGVTNLPRWAEMGVAISLKKRDWRPVVLELRCAVVELMLAGCLPRDLDSGEVPEGENNRRTCRASAADWTGWCKMSETLE